ncbi:T9SS type A sorting domain-containing protein [Flavivirga jejuensis]|uniref:T9SS type A sorting domain-containing protein n=1 Tax=Flavivirga jejuensis TaxID=870487 RepID=A0ABT8WS09_9FLAO|nr:T9SS type A sorting domain-containing protein [Flavivirga jejuensis]MDO5975946.1 T9SS type A sorting domain-containing protein [Flavivirga jejuensis]
MKYIITLFCFLILPITISSQELVSTTIVSKDISCTGACDGEMIINATGGIPPYTYSIDDSFVTSNVFSGLCPGVYEAVVKDSESATVSVILSIQEQAPVTMQVTKTQPSPNTADGAIEISVSGGVSPYTYSIDGDTFQSQNIFSNLSSGTYNVSVKDGNGCTYSEIIAIFPPELVSTVIVSKDISCTGACDGEIIINGTGGIPPYTYSIDDSFVTSNVFSGLCPGIYEAVVKDSESATVSVILSIQEQAPVTMQVTTTQPSPNTADGAIEISASGGVLPYTYSIDGVTFQALNKFSNLSSGTYNVSVKDGNGCLFSDMITINEIDNELTSVFTITGVNYCNGDCSGQIVIDATGGIQPYTYSIDDSFVTSNTFTSLCSGVYEAVVKDSEGATVSIMLSIEEPELLTMEVTNILPSTDVASGVIEISASGGTGVLRYAISPRLDQFYEKNIFDGLLPDTYTVLVQDSNGCFLMETVTVDQISVDNTVTINGDILTPNLEADTYQWINADTQTIIDGATNKTFKAEQTGRYRVEMTITEPGVIVKQAKVAKITSVSSPIYQITVLGVNDNTFDTFKVYPIPADTSLKLPKTSINKNYSIYSVLGQKIDSGKIINQDFSIKALSKGLYYLNIEEHGTSKFIKN